MAPMLIALGVIVALFLVFVYGMRRMARACTRYHGLS
jgi:flagellar biogenesis protein FliO